MIELIIFLPLLVLILAGTVAMWKDVCRMQNCQYRAEAETRAHVRRLSEQNSMGNMIVGRITRRYVCRVCGKPYEVDYPEPDMGKCNSCRLDAYLATRHKPRPPTGNTLVDLYNQTYDQETRYMTSAYMRFP